MQPLHSKQRVNGARSPPSPEPRPGRSSGGKEREMERKNRIRTAERMTQLSALLRIHFRRSLRFGDTFNIENYARRDLRSHLEIPKINARLSRLAPCALVNAL